MKSIAVIESHPIFRKALTGLLGASSFAIVAEGGNATEAMAIAAKHRPDILLVDHVFPTIPELAAVTRVVVFAVAAVEPAVIALDAGASGYILKSADAADLVCGLNTVGAGETYITSGFAGRVIAALRNETIRKAAADAIKLSAREQQIVRLLLVGCTNKQVAAALSISEKTVKHYMGVLMQKVSARNRLEVVLAAQKLAGWRAAMEKS